MAVRPERLRDFGDVWLAAQAGVEVKLVPAPDGQETFLLARSADRREKERAMQEKFTERLEAGLTKMQHAAESGRLKEEHAAGERLGRLKEKNWRASHVFDVMIKRLESRQLAHAGFTLVSSQRQPSDNGS